MYFSKRISETQHTWLSIKPFFLENGEIHANIRVYEHTEHVYNKLIFQAIVISSSEQLEEKSIELYKKFKDTQTNLNSTLERSGFMKHYESGDKKMIVIHQSDGNSPYTFRAGQEKFISI